MIKSTPFPPLASIACWGHFGSLLSIAKSAPNLVSCARLSGVVDVPITVLAPISLAICIAISPTPDEAPCTRTVSPFFNSPTVTIALCIVLIAIGSVTAWAKDIEAFGISITLPQSATAYSA